MAAFIQRVLVALLIAGLVVAAWQLSSLLMALFTAVLLAIALRSSATFISHRAGIGMNAALVAVIALCLVAGGLISWLFGSILSDQFDELARTLPKSLSSLAADVSTHPVGRFLVSHAQDVDVGATTGKIAGFVAAAAGIALNGLLYGVLTVTVGIYLAAQPTLYRDGLLKLAPVAHRAAALALCDKLAEVLRRWLMGQFLVMLVIGVLSGAILWMLGIEAAVALGLTGGLLTFIPYVGAILAAVPAILIAFSQSPVDALLVIAMYLGIHYVEGDFITPWVQAKATALPAAVSVSSTVIFAVLLGPAGVLVAAPLTLILIVLVNELYVSRLEQAAAVDST